MKAERLKQNPLFANLSEHEYDRLERWTDEIDVPAGKPLVREGAYPHEFMVIESGTAEVTYEGNHLADLGPGDFFGEIALLLHVPRTASVTATSDVTLVVMHERDFRAMEDEIPRVHARINDVMEQRRAEAEQKAES